jgi:hypothetical protein
MLMKLWWNPIKTSLSERYEFCLSLLKLMNQLFLVNWFHGWWVQQVFMYTCDDILSGGSHGRRPSCEPAGVSSPDPVPSFLRLSMPSGSVLLSFFFSFSLFLRWEKKTPALFVTGVQSQRRTESTAARAPCHCHAWLKWADDTHAAQNQRA